MQTYDSKVMNESGWTYAPLVSDDRGVFESFSSLSIETKIMDLRLNYKRVQGPHQEREIS